MSRRRNLQRGATLIAMLAILILGASWLLVSRLDALSGDLTAVRRNHNAAVLAEAKRALIGYLAMRAADTSEDEPGALPCPEPAGSAGGASEGSAAGTLALPAVGRLPWKTLGIDQLRDASGEPLWYALADGWGKCGAASTVINSNCASSSADLCWTGQLTVGGQANAAVALIMAPGAAQSGQARSAPAAGIAPANYLECYSTAAAPGAFSMPACSSNDLVIKVTAEDLLPAIEAAVADRFQRQIAPQLRAVYSASPWVSGQVLPFAVPFGNPSSDAGNLDPAKKLQGLFATPQGLLPLNYAYTGPCTCGTPPCTCTLTACTTGTDARCDPSFVAWSGATVTKTGGPANLETFNCTIGGTPTTLTCTLDLSVGLVDALLGNTSMTFNLDAVAANAGMALRKVNTPASGRAPALTGIDTTYKNSPIGYDIPQATMAASGAATIRIDAQVPAGGGSILAVLGALTCNVLGIDLCHRHTVTVPMALLSDHPLVDPSDTTYSWFPRNKWQEVSYYAAAPGLLPGGGGSCTTSGTCLRVSYHPDDGKQRGLIVLSGRSLSGAVRPNGTLADWLEGVNADGASPFAVRDAALTINRSFNDRFAVIDSNP